MIFPYLLLYISDVLLFHPTPICTKTQISCSTNESDDDGGYGSLSSSDRDLSASSSSIASEPLEFSADQQREDTPFR